MAVPRQFSAGEFPQQLAGRGEDPSKGGRDLRPNTRRLRFREEIPTRVSRDVVVGDPIVSVAPYRSTVILRERVTGYASAARKLGDGLTSSKTSAGRKRDLRKRRVKR